LTPTKAPRSVADDVPPLRSGGVSVFVGAYVIRKYDPAEVPLPSPTRFQRIVGIVPEDDIYADASGDDYVRHNANYGTSGGPPGRRTRNWSTTSFTS
jgi:hypothetical protein